MKIHIKITINMHIEIKNIHKVKDEYNKKMKIKIIMKYRFGEI